MIRRITSILILTLSILVGFAQTDSIKGNQFELKGRIINEIVLPAHCGYFAFATVLEFEIIKFSDSNYKLDTICVIVTCPESYGDDFFEVGKIYEMIIADQNQANFNWLILNESVLTKYNLVQNLWIIEALKIE